MHLAAKVACLLGLGLFADAQTMNPSTAGFVNPVIYTSQGGHATCVSGQVFVNVTSPNNVAINLTLPLSQYQISQNIVTSFTPILGMQQSAALLGAKHVVTGNYSIYSTLCTPKAPSYDKKALQFLTHGIGFDQSYWDFLPGYSYVDVAAMSGASTFLYDRLGVGNSSKPDALQDIQGPIQVEIIHVLLQKLKQGFFANTTFPNIVGVGHSFGSQLSQAVTSEYPQDFAGVILTAHTLNLTGMPFFTGSFNLQIAAQNNASRFGQLSTGFLIPQNIISQQMAFFHYDGFTPQVLMSAEQRKQTVTLGELLTLGLVAGSAPKFTGPVFVVNGAFDLAFCFGNCRVNGDQGRPVLTMAYPAVSAANGNTTIIDNTGHGINLHTSAPQAFAQIQQFITSKQL